MTDMEMALMANIAVDMQNKEVNDVLDKIRAEMKPYTDPKGFIVIGENRFNMILDKYKAESEVEDGKTD